MSKWFEVNVITSKTYVIEVEDDQSKDDAEKDVLNECHDGNSEIHDCSELKEHQMVTAKACADEVLSLLRGYAKEAIALVRANDKPNPNLKLLTGMIKEVQEVSDELGIIGMVGSIAWKAQMLRANSNEWISVENVLGGFSITRDITGKKFIVAQSDGSGVVVADTMNTGSIAENILYRLAKHLYETLPSPPLAVKTMSESLRDKVMSMIGRDGLHGAEEIIEVILDKAIDAVKNQHIGENPNGMMRYGAQEAIKAITNLKTK